jgi:Arylsulfotransferase (ASST)
MAVAAFQDCGSIGNMKLNKVQKIALLYFVSLMLVLYGYAVGRFKVFPYAYIEPLVKNFQEFSEGAPGEKKTSVMQKLKNDMGFSFDRFLWNYPEQAFEGTDKLEYAGFLKRKEPPLLYLDENHREGYRVIAGALNLPGAFWGAILLNPEGEVIHRWDLSTEHLPTNLKQDQLKLLYGLAVYPDGSIIFHLESYGGGIVKVDACGKEVWNLPGQYHHAVTPDDQGYFWSFEGFDVSFDQDIVRVSAETGEIERIIKMEDVRRANPDIHIWTLQRFILNKREANQKHGDMTHGNDIDPLPENLAHLFPQFSAGDLAISYATTNLIFVLDPDTLKVKWWRMGAADFQHDPDWEPDGRLVIYDNNGRVKADDPTSEDIQLEILAFDMSSMEHETILDGKQYDAMSQLNGRHQLTPYGTRFVTSAQQGWAFEVDEDGKIIFSFVNNVSEENRQSMHMSDAWRFSEDYFDSEFWTQCDQ